MYFIIRDHLWLARVFGANLDHMIKDTIDIVDALLQDKEYWQEKEKLNSQR